MFNLDSRLEADTFFIADLKISKLLLMNDSGYLWLILVPKEPNLVELTDLSFAKQTQVLEEINLVGKIIKEEFGFQKLNIAALGNVVKQLHIHVIGRNEDDAVFPKPVWGHSVIKPYKKEEAEKLVNKIRELL